MNTFLKGTFILAGAAFVSELIEFLVNMVLARELGKEGMGLYMSILPTIFLIATIANLELPVSISKFLTEHDRKEHRHMLGHALSFVTMLTVFLLIGGFFLFPYIPIFHEHHPLIKWIVLAFIPIISYSAVLRGYFMGVHNMSTIAVSNFIRKAIQLTILFVVFKAFHFVTIEMALFTAICTLIGSEGVVLLYLLIIYLSQLHHFPKGKPHQMSGADVRRKLLSVSLPTTGLRIFNSVANAIQPFLIKKALILSGLTASLANQHFGLMAGVAMSIGFFPAFFAHSLLVALIPAVSEAYAKNDQGKLQQLLQQSMQITILYGLPAIVMMYVFAEPLTNLFFRSPEAVFYLHALWPYFLFHFFAIPLQAYLIGLGLVKDTLYHTIWSYIVSFSMIYYFGSQHDLGMIGVIMGMNTGILLLMLLHYVTICQAIDVSYFLTKRKNPLWK
ncbi:polysaccharide biosynthesis protein [Bacillus songklensis]|uniref:Polysaccharide biosynthesis protein n=1 Tax=Bacillus songklensis TaxID=1069116 RepID=A0ABV8B777_9BACI